MPVYEFTCNSCRGKKVFEVFRPFSESGKPQNCPSCGREAARVYSFTRPKEFTPYFDEKFRTVVSSGRQERALMKKHGQIYTRDTGIYSKYKDKINTARRKPVHFIPGVKNVHIDRD